MRCPPPPKFKAAVGVRSAQFLAERPPFIKKGRSTGRFAVGIRYEREAKEWLSLFALGQANLRLLDGPWLAFQDDSGKRWCQPDAVLLDDDLKECTIIEIKYQHTSDAWYQLKQLYLPVLRCALQGYSFRLLELVHWLDAAASWPEELISVPTLDSRWRDQAVATLIFNKRRERRILEARDRQRSGGGQADGPLWPAKGAE